ncbi:MAG: hypothetical protein KA004_16210 [Verrucomicrobiales bacterium]|nr:hypothetical protein [Verrucomicrobiales bacterium]
MDILLKAIESKLQSAGLNWIKLQSFSLSAKEKTLAASVQLDGEPDPVEITAHYKLDAHDLVVTRVETSKKWMTEVAALALIKTGGKIKLPTGIKGKLVRLLL